MKAANSRTLHAQARRVMVGGVSSPVRSFRAVGGTPLFLVRGRGSKVWDADGNSFIDYVCSWGPLILGHSNPAVVKAVNDSARAGTSFGAPSVSELRLAQKVCRMMPSVEKVRFVSSGTEATMSAIRLARAYSGRSKFLKFEGCYHGHADQFLSRAGSGLATFDMADSAGVPEATVKDTLTVPFNDGEALEEAFHAHGNKLGAAIIEPVAGNMGVVPPERGYLERLRRLCDDNGTVLIFDEVITGFRVAPGGAQELYGVTPDLTCLGKVIGGGFPVGAYGGKATIMSMVAPEGPVYQAGTLSGNPVAMAAGFAALSQLNKKAYSKLERLSAQLEAGLLEAASAGNVPFGVNRVGSMIGIFFTAERVRNFSDAKESKHSLYPRFHRRMLESGVYLPPSAFETVFTSTAHSENDVATTAMAAKRAFQEAAS